jgi:hypothetical protein
MGDKFDRALSRFHHMDLDRQLKVIGLAPELADDLLTQVQMHSQRRYTQLVDALDGSRQTAQPRVRENADA